MRAGPLILAAGILGALVLYSRRAQAAALPQVPPGLPLPWETGRLDAPSLATPWASDDTGYQAIPPEPWASDDTGADWFTPEPETPFLAPEGFMPATFPGGPLDAALDGLLYAIRTAEVGRVPDAERYFYGYGFARFSGTDDHPIITGELRPVPLPERFCRAAGLRPGCVSTAAGAYQFIRPTWERLRQAGRWGPRLPDFSPASQDEAARRLLREIGAARALERGDTQDAIARSATQWASLPGSTAQQGGISMARALALVAEGSGGAASGGMVT